MVTTPRALLVRYHSLGDVVLTTGVVRALHQSGLRVDVLTEKPFRSVFEGSPYVSQLFFRHDWDPSRRYERVVDLQGSPSSRAATRGTNERTEVDTRSVARRWVVLWGDRPPRPKIPHSVARYAEAAFPDPAKRERPALDELYPEVHVTDGDRSALTAECPGLSPESTVPRVALLTGASRVSKAYPREKFVTVGRAFEERGWEVLWVEAPPSSPSPGTRSESADRSARSIAPNPPAPVGQRVAVSLGALKAALASTQLAISGDSGPMHLATALDIPVIAIFGSSVPAFGFAPLGRRTRVLHVPGLRCRPCGVHGRNRCWRGGFPCLDVSPEEVVRAGLELVADSGVPLPKASRDPLALDPASPDRAAVGRSRR